MKQAKPKTTPDTIWFLITDLEAYGTVRSKFKRKGAGAKKSKKALSLYHFALFKHWAVRVRDHCYEVNVRRDAEGERIYFLNKVHFSEWEKNSKRINVRWEPIEVGATYASDSYISEQADLVWNTRCNKKYQLLSSNCQNFANCLYQTIAVDPSKIDKEMQEKMKGMPFRLTQLHTLLKRMTPMLVRGFMLEGLELTVEAAAIIGLEALGMSLLGPVGEIILIISIVAPLIYIKSKDTKWFNQMFGKKARPGDLDSLAEYQMEQVIKEFAEEVEHTTLPPPYSTDNQAASQEVGVTEPSLPELPPRSKYKGYDEASVNRYVGLGFTIEHVVAIMQEWGITSGDGTEFSFDDADHRLLIEGLMGQHGFDKVTEARAVFAQRRKPLPATVTTDHWASMIDTKLASPGTASPSTIGTPILPMDIKDRSTIDTEEPTIYDTEASLSDVNGPLLIEAKPSIPDVKPWQLDTKLPLYDSKDPLKFEEEIRAGLERFMLSCA